MNFFGFGATPEIEIILDGQDKRKLAEVKKEDGKREKHLLYYDGESVSGQVNITLRRAGAKLEHQGIRIELIGQIELFYDRGNHYSFLSLYKELARPGELLHHQTHRFEFTKVAKPFETYTGTNCLLRYFLRVSIMKRLTDIVKEREIVVHTLSQYPDLNNSIKMEVGIEDCLHIEFEYNRSMYHLKDVIIGKIYFLLVRIKIKHMELAIIKRETTGSGPNTFNENDTLARFEIMDGAPVRGESIPIRLFLAGYDLTPTFKDVNRKFSVRYYLNLVLVDEEDRRYFKQQEIILWRKVDKPRKTFQASLQQQYRQMQNPNSHNVSPSTSNACRFNGQSASSSNGSVSDAVASTSSVITANDQDRVQVANPSALKENKGGLHRDMATLEISNGKNGDMNFEGDDDITDGRNVSNGDQKYSIPLPKKSAGDMQQKKMENGGGNNARLVGYQDGERQSPFSAGASKTLSGDDSDDDTPKLTGSICQADVHNMSHELAVDAAAIVGEDGGKEE